MERFGKLDASTMNYRKDENGNPKNGNMVSISGKNSLVLGEERLIAYRCRGFNCGR